MIDKHRRAVSVDDLLAILQLPLLDFAGAAIILQVLLIALAQVLASTQSQTISTMKKQGFSVQSG